MTDRPMVKYQDEIEIEIDRSPSNTSNKDQSGTRTKICIAAAVAIVLMALAALFLTMKSLQGDIKHIDHEMKQERAEMLNLVRTISIKNGNTTNSSKKTKTTSRGGFGNLRISIKGRNQT